MREDLTDNDIASGAWKQITMLGTSHTGRYEYYTNDCKYVWVFDSETQQTTRFCAMSDWARTAKLNKITLH